MFSDDQWSISGEDSERCCSSIEGQLGRLEEGFGRFSQTIQQQTERDGEMEGMFTHTLYSSVWSNVFQKKHNIQVVQQ